MDRFPAALALQDLHPGLWLGHQLGRPRGDGVTSGFAALDAQLPGGGWPRRALTELLQSTAPVRRQAPAPAAESAGQAALNDAETADLQERLRGLGYL